jgi:hypothetical protein
MLANINMLHTDYQHYNNQHHPSFKNCGLHTGCAIITLNLSDITSKHCNAGNY